METVGTGNTAETRSLQPVIGIAQKLLTIKFLEDSFL
jgi:hypothetical protein